MKVAMVVVVIDHRAVDCDHATNLLSHRSMSASLSGLPQVSQ